jgi:uncharacterized protein YndB with AHSA1/START domain
MATTGASPAAKLQLRRTFQATREKVFEAWTEPEQMKHWCAPTGDYEVSAESELREGGRYRIQMKHKDGNVHTAFGEFRQVQPPAKLVYTWSWEDGSVSDSLVTVEFRDLGQQTEVILTHERFPSEDWRDKHSQGWTGCLDRLEQFLEH